MQCTWCQLDENSKAYCTRRFQCGKYGGDYNSFIYQISKEISATCLLYGKDHPADYIGYEVFMALQTSRRRPNVGRGENYIFQQ